MTLVRRWLPAVVAFAIVLGLWEGLVRVFDVQAFILPRPSAIVLAFAESWTTVWPFAVNTLIEAIGGFVIGTVAAIALALIATRWVTLGEGLLPFAVAASAMPIVALAPITNQWFTITSPVSKMAVVSVMVFFPVFVNTTRGLNEVDPREIELMRSVAATPTSTMINVRVPNALPFLFSALKVASALALIGAIVAEYFGGSQEVLGQYIISRASAFQFPEAWAAILVASLLGIGFYLIILAAERAFMPWHVSLRTSGRD